MPLPVRTPVTLLKPCAGGVVTVGHLAACGACWWTVWAKPCCAVCSTCWFQVCRKPNTQRRHTAAAAAAIVAAGCRVALSAVWCPAAECTGLQAAPAEQGEGVVAQHTSKQQASHMSAPKDCPAQFHRSTPSCFPLLGEGVCNDAAKQGGTTAVVLERNKRLLDVV